MTRTHWEHHPSDYAALRTAWRVLVKAAGGLEVASSVTGAAVSRLHAGYDPNQADRFARVDHVADLEAVAATPLVTFHLARLAGCTLLPLPRAAGQDGAVLADVLRGAGELGGRVAAAMGDGALDDAERAALVEQLGALSRAVAHAQAVLAGPRLPIGHKGAA